MPSSSLFEKTPLNSPGASRPGPRRPTIRGGFSRPHPIEAWRGLSSRTKKAAGIGAIAAGGVWGIGTWDWSPLEVKTPVIEIPSPSEAGAELLYKTGDVIEFGFRGLGHLVKLTNGSNDTEAQSSAGINVTVDTVTLPPAAPNTNLVTLPADNSATNLPTIPALIPPETSLTIPASTEVLDNLLPNPVIYSEAAGSVVCSGQVIRVTVTPDGGFPLRQLESQTGEGWTQSAISGSNPLDEALFNEVLSTRQDNSDGSYSVFVRDSCAGLEQ